MNSLDTVRCRLLPDVIARALGSKNGLELKVASIRFGRIQCREFPVLTPNAKTIS